MARVQAAVSAGVETEVAAAAAAAVGRVAFTDGAGVHS